MAPTVETRRIDLQLLMCRKGQTDKVGISLDDDSGGRTVEPRTQNPLGP
jgi:hypothetical protein